ncbi:MAG TPA: hypothetical protein VNW06_05965 [Cytophagaceae bacterium]|jgi:hypothetical protein|nr:hypothetical protein [Cytophagaceae bacterium]
MKCFITILFSLTFSYNCSSQNRSYDFLNDYFNSNLHEDSDTIYFCPDFQFDKSLNEWITNKTIRSSISKCLKDTFPLLERKLSKRISFRIHSFKHKYSWDAKKIKSKRNIISINNDFHYGTGKPFRINDTLIVICSCFDYIHTSYYVSIYYWNQKTKEVRFVIGAFLRRRILKFR